MWCATASAPAKIAFLAEAAWGDAIAGDWPAHVSAADRRAFSRTDILHWLGEFARRFYGSSQFKRSAVPNGPKLTSAGALSPRGDWRMPSDSSAAVWREAVEALKDELL
jgi:NAD+ synthase (glutamine-hydrolysing)